MSQLCSNLQRVSTSRFLLDSTTSFNCAQMSSFIRRSAADQIRRMSTKKGGKTANKIGQKAVLVMENGMSFEGTSFGSTKSSCGEIVFNTGMMGYPDSLTDPSYRGQILLSTYPIVGNYGVPAGTKDGFGLNENWESSRIQAKGLIVADYCHEYSHWKAHQSLSDWLIEYDVPGITGVDTRMLTKMIRDAGEMKGKIVIGDNDVSWDVPELLHPVSEVSCKKPYTVGKGDIKILAIDTGMKDSMLRCLVARGATVKVVPYNYDISKEEYDGLFISNGPGDPMRCTETVSALKKALTEDKPIFGICLGTQLMALAAGAKTYKLPFGHRGQNQPCINVLDERCYITSQNHSYAVDENTLPEGWSPLFVNANDGSVEGIYHTTKPFFSVQFHPEARCGPEDTHFLFDKFLDSARRHKQRLAFDPSAGLYPFLNNDSVGLKLGQGDSLKSVVEFPKVYREPLPKKVLVLGSGGLQIGQAGEFDYSGSQCLKALKEEGIKTVLMNPNIATVQTAEGLADEVYFLPVTPEFVEAVIRKERPDAVMLQFGGQTALNCGIELHRTGVFSKNGVRVLGTSVESIIKTEDRDLFNQALAEINEKFATSISVYTVEDALKAADKIGYPIIARCGFALGGLGSGFADNANELRDLAKKALAVTPQILVEKSLRGWKELEYEVVRDASNNCVTVCNMENFDPLGIHTGDSIVVSPSQTLDDHEYHLLRNVSIRVVRHLGIIGECNIQYALDPNSDDYRIIEVNPRLSRSSALASKATGYPLAYVAARLALGMPLPHVKNAVTRKTTACFEPALDYIVCKVPRWDMAKFKNCNHVLGSAMKSVGEIMSVGRTFEEAFQKALRMVNDANTGFDPKSSKKFPDMEHALRVATDDRIWALAQCMREGWSVDKVWSITKIDKWFLNKLKKIIDCEVEMKNAGGSMQAGLIKRAKLLGFSDRQIGKCYKIEHGLVRSFRKENNIVPYAKQIDTLAAEWPAQTNYLYMSYLGSEHDVKFDQKDGVVVLGGGCYRIGSSVEFDYSAVMSVRSMRAAGKPVSIINCNPETVSTDFDESDRLYFEELSEERVLDIVDNEKPMGTVVSVGGQIGNNLCMPLHEAGVHILGTHPEMIDTAEDRNKFSKMLDEIGVAQPEWQALTSPDAAAAFAEKVGYPVLVRASYVLSGGAFRVVRDSSDLKRFLADAVDISNDKPVVITKYLEGAQEVEIDAVANKGNIVAYAIAEHIENAGVHSGDAHMVLPAQNMSFDTFNKVLDISKRMAKALKISGPMNSQFLVKDGEVKVIEVNVRASRSLPFSSKTLGVNMIDLAARIWLGEDVKPVNVDLAQIKHVGVKVPQFSFTRLRGADPTLGVEMASTGEVACYGHNQQEALLKGMMAAQFKMPKKKILFSLPHQKEREALLSSIRTLKLMGYEIFATSGTAEFLQSHNVPHTRLLWDNEQGEGQKVNEVISNRAVDLVINLPSPAFADQPFETSHGYKLRRTAVDHGVMLLTNEKVAAGFVDSMARARVLTVEPYRNPMKSQVAAATL